MRKSHKKPFFSYSFFLIINFRLILDFLCNDDNGTDKRSCEDGHVSVTTFISKIIKIIQISEMNFVKKIEKIKLLAEKSISLIRVQFYQGF